MKESSNELRAAQEHQGIVLGGNGKQNATDLLRLDSIKDAVSALYPFDIDEEKATYKDVLRGLSVFGHQRVDAMLETGTEDQIVRLIGVTAVEIMNMIASLPDDKRNQAKWADNTQKVQTAVKEVFPEWFDTIEEKIRLRNLASQLSTEIQFAKGRVLKLGSASFLKEEEANNFKAQVQSRFDEIKAKIETSECMAETKTVLLGTELPDALSQCLAFVEVKLAEEPVRILYYRTGNQVAVKLQWNKNSWQYNLGRGREVRLNKGKDRDQYKLIVSLGYIEDFLYQNGVGCEDVWVEENSVEACYRFRNKVSVTLTPSFVKEWYNYDAPTLERISPNHGKRGETMLGMKLGHFTTNLVESSWSADYIDASITKEEADALIKGFEQTRISKEIRNKLKAQELKDAGEIDNIKTAVEAYDAKIQEVIDEHAGVVTNSLAVAFYDRVIPATGTDGASGIKFNDNFGLDCGFLNIQVNDPEYMEKRSILRNVSSSASPWMELKMPIFSQSTTFMKKQFDIVKEIIQNKMGIELIGHTVLD
jgi:hypothetical protein